MSNQLMEITPLRAETMRGLAVAHIPAKAVWLDYGYIRAEVSLHGKRAVRVACYWDRAGERIARLDALNYMRNYMGPGLPSDEYIELGMVEEAQERIYLFDSTPTG